MSIPAERLREGQQILVRGKVSFSRLAQLIEGEALERSIAQALQRGSLYPTRKPHTMVNLVDAQVLVANPANMTPEEQFVQEKIYPVKSGDNAGKAGYGIDNVSTYLPTVLEADPETPGTYRQLVLERDLASGMDVTLVLQVFKPKGYEKRGIGLQQVVLNEPVRYFSSGMDTSALAARGIIVTGGVRPVTAAESPAAAAAAVAPGEVAADVSIPANSQVNANGLPGPTPGAQGAVPAPSRAAQMFPQSSPAAAPVAQVQAPVAYAPATQAQTPVAQAAPMETAEQTIARLQQQLAEKNVAAQASGGGSAFDNELVGAGAPAAAPGPWDVPGQPAATHQG